MDCLTMEDWSNSMSNWVSNSNWMGSSMGNWVSHSNWVSNSMGNWMSNNSWVSHGMGNRVGNNSWVSNSMGNWVSNNGSLDNSRSILRNSLIGDILNNSISIVSIGDSLGSSIGKSNSVASRCSISISGLSLLEVGSTVVIIDSISVAVYWGLSKVRRSVSWSSYKGTCRGTGSSGYKGSNNEDLHV